MSGEPRDDLVPATAADLLVLDALWTGAINDWDGEQRHLRLLEHAQKNGLLLEVARRYGTVRDDPVRGAIARKRLDAIALVATHELLATRTVPGSGRPPTWLWALGLLICAALLTVAIVWGWRARP